LDRINRAARLARLLGTEVDPKTVTQVLTALQMKVQSVPAGWEVVPTHRAEALVAYLQSLKDTYDYPTERSLNTPAEHPKGEGH